ncbi:outer surface protein [Serratia phage vB_SmaM-Yubaba]|nr:outer surface protein [Serratia phage vB_SmaM-Yubaba]
MFVDPDKPLPPAGAKVDTLGSVLEAIIEIGNAKAVSTGDAAEFERRVTEALQDVDKIIDGFQQDATNAIKAHTDLQGAVHGETKTTVGLDKKENWKMATPQEHLDGESQDTFCNPVGLAALVKKYMSIDPDNYIRSRLMPIASGGQLGNVPQWPFNWKEGEVVESPKPAMDYYTETPWQFSTDQGVRLYPAMNGSDILTQARPDTGRARRAVTPWGGTDVRVYNSTLDLRRTRPGVLRAESNIEPNNQLLRGSPHLFDRHCVYYVEDQSVKVRAFNKIRLPFDILDNAGLFAKNWEGIVESRESTIYNPIVTIQRGNLGSGDSVYLAIDLDLYSFVEHGTAAKDGPGNPSETVATLGDKYTTINWQVGNNKFKIYNRPNTGVKGVYLDIKSILNFTQAQLDGFWNNFNHSHAKHVAFTWLNRLKGEFAIRIPIGFYTKDKKHYINYYMDLSFKSKEVGDGKTATVTIDSLRDIDSNIQTLDDNYQVKPTGRFVEYNADVTNDIFHPLVFNGIFESQGGHIKTYTYYNRQYVGYYQHNVGDTKEWIANGDEIKPKLIKYNYGQISTLNQDGLYGDHLRHIPLNVENGTVNYLTLTRDWANTYRWGICNANLDNKPVMYSSGDHAYGPWRNTLTWMNPNYTRIPDFLVVNEENSSNFDTSCLVFNTQNEFKGYAKFSFDTADTQATVKGVDPVGVDDQILSYIATLGGGWTKNHRQMFYFQNRLYFFSQCLSVAEWPADNVDCYYGWVSGAYIDVTDGVRTIKINGNLKDQVTAKPLKVNNKRSATADWTSVFGRDRFESTDTYLMLMNRNGNVSKYKLMVNLAPHNNFYFEFELTVDAGQGTTTLQPDPGAIDPVFPYDSTTGYNVDYEAVSAYKTLVPHHMHVNFQSPVMMKKSLWSYRKTPGIYGVFSMSGKTTLVNGGLMNAIEGTNIYPMGSLVTIGGGNSLVKLPVDAADKLYPDADELFVRQNGTALELYGRKYNPNNYETEPNAGVVPCGFLKNSTFTHYDQDGWRNALLPVIDSLRMNYYGYGSSFPAFMGIYGEGKPINRFFLNIKGTTFKWDTAQGRAVPLTGSNAIKINGQAVQPNGTGVYNIPSSYTGVVTLEISGLLELKWGKGLVELVEIGSSVSTLNFKNSTDFTITAELPGNVIDLDHTFEGATGSTYKGIEKWDTSNISSMEATFKNAVNFNADISNWDVNNVKSMKEMFMGTKKFNQPIGNWNYHKVLTMESMFENALAFNQNFSNNSPNSLQSASKMFKGTTVFDGDMTNWLTATITDVSGMFKNAQAFTGKGVAKWVVTHLTNAEDMFSATKAFMTSGDLSNWKLTSCVNLRGMFEDSNFNAKVDNWVLAVDVDCTRMFSGTPTFNQPLTNWNFGNIKYVTGMFQQAKGFNQPMPNITWTRCASFNTMFYASVFNSTVKGWKFADANSTAGKNGIDFNYMFAFTKDFNDPDIVDWDTSNVVSMEGTFKNTNLFNQPIGKWNTKSLQTIQGMFRAAVVFNQDISMWDTSKVVDMSEVFMKAAKFNQDISAWNTDSVTSMYSMFETTGAFGTNGNKFSLSKWNTKSVRAANRMFAESKYNASVEGCSWGLSADLTGMFQNNTEFNQPLTGWVVNNVRYVKNMFYGATAFNSSVKDLNWEKCEDFSSMFEGATKFNQDLGTWQFSKWPNGIILSANMFKDCPTFKGIGLDKWTGLNFTSVAGMFQNCTVFEADISNWTINRITNLISTFEGCSSFNCDLTRWDTSKVTLMTSTFKGCSMFNGDISNWNTGMVSDMTSMFMDCTNFKGDISGWNVKNVVRFTDMFNNASAFDADLSAWDTTTCINYSGMFKSAVSFNKNIGSWKTSRAVNMNDMFNGAAKFNQPIGSWDTSIVTDMISMFMGALSFNQDLSKWDVKRVNKHANFDTNAPSWVAPKPNFVL